MIILKLIGYMIYMQDYNLQEQGQTVHRTELIDQLGKQRNV